MIPSLFPWRTPTPEELAAHARWREERLARAVPWTPDIKFDKALTIQAATYPVRHLFDVPATSERDPHKASASVDSPNGRWRYIRKTLPRGSKLALVQGKQRGDVVFDGPVDIPTLHDLNSPVIEPWMSLTPMEMLTLRGGTRLAKGRVIVAGLGLGHQLIEVSLRRQVKRLTLVERDPELIEWLLPKITPFLGKSIDEVCVGDAYAEIPKMEADVCLLDIFPSYGGNAYLRDRLARNSPHVKKFWAWGSTEIGG